MSSLLGLLLAAVLAVGPPPAHDVETAREPAPRPLAHADSIPVTDTDALHPDELIEMTKDMSPDEYAREMLCSFAAPTEGAYYGDLMNDAEARIIDLPYDPSASVNFTR